MEPEPPATIASIPVVQAFGDVFYQRNYGVPKLPIGYPAKCLFHKSYTVANCEKVADVTAEV
jgi:hypothetical protein